MQEHDRQTIRQRDVVPKKNKMAQIQSTPFPVSNFPEIENYAPSKPYIYSRIMFVVRETSPLLAVRLGKTDPGPGANGSIANFAPTNPLFHGPGDR